MRIFKEPFMATGSEDDITLVNFNHLGLYKKEIFDGTGDLIRCEFYKNYDSENDIFLDLAVLEERTYDRDNVTGLVIKRTTTITWYGMTGAEIAKKENIEKIYTFQKGYTANKRARRNLLDKASIYFYSTLLVNANGDTAVADQQKDDFDTHTIVEQKQYINSTIAPLIEKINQAQTLLSGNYKDYMTPAMIATMISILDVRYDQGA